jgi:hypothetical protein
LILLDGALGRSDAVEVVRHLEGAASTGKVKLISAGNDPSRIALRLCRLSVVDDGSGGRSSGQVCLAF